MLVGLKNDNNTNTKVTEKIAVATIILYVEPSFPAYGFVLVGQKILMMTIVITTMIFMAARV